MSKKQNLDLSRLRTANVRRCKHFGHTLFKWSATDWGCALAGEVGEALNLVKKIKRGDFSEGDVREDIADELADILIYLDLLAARLGIDLSEATIRKFDRVSARIGADQFLADSDDS